MRCQSCQKLFTGRPNFCPSCGKSIDWGLIKKQRKRSSFIAAVAFFLIFLGIAYTITSYSSGTQSSNAVAAFFYAGAGIFGLIVASHFLRILSHYLLRARANGKRSPLRIVIFSALIGLLLVSLLSLYLFISYDSMEQSLLVLQDTAAEATMAKLIGDGLQRRQAVLPTFASMSWVASTARIRTDWLFRYDPNNKLSDYQKALTAWTAQIRDAGGKPSEWQNVPAAPRDFTLSLNDHKASELLLVSVKQLAILKQMGDLAVKNEDRQAMRYVAAKLLLQKHWLEGLAHSKDSGFFAFRLMPRAYAYDVTPRTVCYYNRPVGNGGKMSYCAEEAITTTTEMYNAAESYAEEGETADENWIGLNDYDGMQMLGCYGCVFTGEPDEKVQYPEMVQDFMDDCHGRGGTIDGAGTVKTRMPTTESGYTCVYNRGGKSCWDMLTYSGGYYAGGNTGCPEANLLPQVVVEPPGNDDNGDGDTNSAGVNVDGSPSTNTGDGDVGCDIDGDYSVSGTIVMTSNLEALNFSQPTSHVLQVRNNALIDTEGGSHPIGSDGRVTISEYVAMPSDEFGTSGSGGAYVTYDFYCSGGQALVSGVFSGSTSASNEGFSITIQYSGNVSGGK